MGVPTNGSTCVQGIVNSEDSLVVVGGSTSTQDYLGLQHFSFITTKWQSDTPASNVTKNRQFHGTAYLNDSSTILMYAGSQDSLDAPSTQTFIISTIQPYNVRSFVNRIAPPVSRPLMMSFNTTHALMLGGGTDNKNLYTFGPNDGWQQMDVSLQSDVKDINQVQATILDGSDGSKVLEIFDMSTTPNQISQLLLQNATSTQSPGKRARSYIPSAHHSPKRRKRDTAFASRPAYNNTLAPQDTRHGFSLAQDPKTGVVVASGGNDQAPLAMFNETGNQWIDPNQFFGNEPNPTTSATPTTSTPPPKSSTQASQSAAASTNASNDHVRNKSLSILGGVLGGVFGLAALLILSLLLVRFCKRRKEKKKREQEANDFDMEDKEGMDFADVGAPYMEEGGGGTFPESNHRRKRSEKSETNQHVKEVANRAGAASSQSKRALLHVKGDSAGSGNSFWSRGTKSPEKEKSPPTISAPILGPAPGTSPDPRADPHPRSDDTGWSTYFTNESRDYLAGAPTNASNVRPETQVSRSQSQSDYTSSRVASSNPHESAEVEPLNLRASQSASIYPPNSRVMSPTGFPRPGLGLALTRGHGPDPDHEPPTPSTQVSDIDEEDEFAGHSHSDGQDSWSPVAATGDRDSRWTEDRPASSIYTPHPGERVRIPNFPAVPDSQRPPVGHGGVTSPISPAAERSERGLRNIASRDFARTSSGRQRTGPGMDNGEAMPGFGASQARPFPRKQDDLVETGRRSSQVEDMSWLNLGTSVEQNNHLRSAGQ